MAKVTREISLTHDGKTKTLTVSNRIIARIDGDLLSVGKLGFMGTLSRMEAAAVAAQKDSHSVEAADFPIFNLAMIVSALMVEAGFVVSEDDVYDDLVDDMQNNGAANTMPILERLFEIVSPPERAAKNSPAPAQVGAVTKPKRKPSRK